MKNETPSPDAVTLAAVTAYLGKPLSAYAPENIKLMCETHKVNALYPGEYVVFEDHTAGAGNDMQLVKRDVLFHSKSEQEAQVFLEGLPVKKQRKVCLDYIERPGEGRLSVGGGSFS